MNAGQDISLWRDNDDPSSWGWAALIFALYLLVGYGLEYRSKKRRGAARPARAAVDGLFSEREGLSGAPEHHFVSRMVMMGGALVVGCVGFLTRDLHTVVHVVAMGVAGLLGIFACAYFDHRNEPRRET
ncbi:hypothetical protein [Streptomyces sp. NPDC049916]|uniref:hypothetical protein n=1 Tax=Streptomyces sp. NPDC049916 TaxID=3155156 RepID=UPI003429F45A